MNMICDRTGECQRSLTCQGHPGAALRGHQAWVRMYTWVQVFTRVEILTLCLS